MEKIYDVVVVGGGPGGYSCAIRCAQLGFSVACIDDRVVDNKASFGGVCLNVGCIPSKALLALSERYALLQHSAEFGISADKLTLDLDKVHEHRIKTCQQLCSGIEQLLAAAKVDVIHARAEFIAKDKLKLVHAIDGSEQEIGTRNLVLAMGSAPIELKSMQFDGDHIVDSTGALEFEQVPKNLGIVGAGVIGLELGSVWSRFGSEVTIFEALPDFLPMLDKRVAAEALKIYKKSGLNIKLGVSVDSAEVKSGQVEVKYQEQEKVQSVQLDKLIVAVGRRPNSHGLDSLKLEIARNGEVQVDDHCFTGIDGVYAIGDLVRGEKLAHKSIEEGVMVAERLKGHANAVSYDLIPSVIYTEPEISWIGKSETQAKAEGLKVKVAQVPLASNGRSLATGETSGFVRLIADEGTDKILGAQVIAKGAAEIVQQVAIGCEFGAVAEDIGLTMFSHPTVSEALHEAALMLNGQAIHMVNRKK